MRALKAEERKQYETANTNRVAQRTGCGYHFGPKEIMGPNENGEMGTVYSCGSYMRVSSTWGNSTYEVFFTDKDGLAHYVYGAKQVVVSDIPSTIQEPCVKP